ncbi:MAG: NADH-quinone oxidoreductase subunit NuoG [bacterium]|nr:MAG: NADH-quinone oxidoreductase subunit NuoG [bacterium]
MMVRLTIDGKQVMVDGHISVLDAARKLGIHIPTFCHHPRLSELGACRMCLVEVQGMGKLQTACTLAVNEGMEVRTATPRVEKARKNMLEFLLINHPLECTVCDASGECTLQDLAFKYGSADTRFAGRKRVLRDNIISPLIDRNLNRCIQCKRCVRICDEVQGVTALGMAHRGASTVVGPFMDKALDCEYCSHCIWSCPVGAITSRAMKQKVRTWEMSKVEAICPLCSVGCTLVYNHRDNKVFRVSHTEEVGVNYGSLCAKGYFGYDMINHPDRVTTPLVRRKDGTLQPASWEEALEVVATRLTQIADDDGGTLLGGIATDRITNEELYLFQKLMRSAFGSNNVDTPSGIWSRKVLPVLEERLGVFAATNSLDELNYVDGLLIVGCDVTVANPITGLKVKRAIARGARVTEVYPGRTALSRLAARSLTVPVGLELAVIKGMIKVILQENLADPELLKGLKGLSRLQESVREKDLAQIAAECGIRQDEIVQVAREFAGAKRFSVIFGEIAALQPGGEKLINALLDLMMLTGRLGSEGNGLYPILSATNFQGAVDMGVDPSMLPGRQPVTSAQARKKMEKAWGTPIPSKAGLDALQMIQAAADGKLRGLYLVGVNLFSTFPGGARVKKALDKLEFLVVQELFLTETARLADVVLPAGTLAERNGTLTNVERRIQRTRKAIDGVGQSMPDWKIFSDLGVTMGKPGLRYVNAAEILDEVAANVPYYSGVSYRILADNGLQWPFSKEDAREVYHEGYLGTRHLLKDGVPKDKMALAAVPEWTCTRTDSRHPMTLILGEILFHSGSFTRHSGSLNQLVGRASLMMNPQTAFGLDLPEGSTVKVVSQKGQVTAPVEYSDDLVPGVLFMPRHFADAPASELMVPDIQGETQTAVVSVRVEKT